MREELQSRERRREMDAALDGAVERLLTEVEKVPCGFCQQCRGLAAAARAELALREEEQKRRELDWERAIKQLDLGVCQEVWEAYCTGPGMANMSAALLRLYELMQGRALREERVVEVGSGQELMVGFREGLKQALAHGPCRVTIRPLHEKEKVRRPWLIKRGSCLMCPICNVQYGLAASGCHHCEITFGDPRALEDRDE